MKVRLIKKCTVQDDVYQNKASYFSFKKWLDKLKIVYGNFEIHRD